MATQRNSFEEHCRRWLAREQETSSSGVMGVTQGKNSSVRNEVLQHTPQIGVSDLGEMVWKHQGRSDLREALLEHQGSRSVAVALAEACQRQLWRQAVPLGISHPRDLPTQSSDTGARAELWTTLPAELRNEVYHLVLCTSKDDVDITEPFPPITRTCKQMRFESMPVFLDSRKFHDVVTDQCTTRLLAWLTIFEGIDDNRKRTFGGLDIACTGSLIEFDTFGNCSHEQGDFSCWCPNFELWDNVVASIKRAGLTAGQLQIRYAFIQDVHDFLNHESVVVRHARPSLLCGVVCRDKRAPEAYLFSRYIIPSLLRMHGLYDENAPPADFLDSLLRIEMFQTPACFVRMENVITSTANSCNTPPETWFEDWALRAPATTGPRAAVHEECRRLMQQHCYAQFRGLAGGHVGLLRYHQAVEETSRPQSQVCAECVKDELAERRERESLLRGL